MINRLKCASISDDKASKILKSWVHGGPNEADDGDIEDLMDWYEDNFDKSSMSIYRGLYFKKMDFKKMLIDGAVELEDDNKRYDSWTLDPKLALNFASQDRVGVVISRKINPSEEYVDVIKSYNYLKNNYKDMSSMLYDYTKECEIIASSNCKVCVFGKEVEFVYADKHNYVVLLNEVGKMKYWRHEIDDFHPSYKWKDVFVKFDGMRLFPIGNLADAIKHLNLKPNTKC